MNRQIIQTPLSGEVQNRRPAAATEGPTGTVRMTVHVINWAGLRRTRRLRNPKPALVARARKQQREAECGCEHAYRIQTVILTGLATVCATVATIALVVAAARGGA